MNQKEQQVNVFLIKFSEPPKKLFLEKNNNIMIR